MRPPRAAAVAALALAGILLAGAAAPSPRETIDIGVEDAAAPWSQPDGTGYANDVVRAAFAAVGADVRMHVLPYARCKQRVLQGSLVACVSMSPAPELEGAVRFSQRPLFVFACEFFGRTDRVLPRRIEELAPGTRVGLVLSYEYPPEMMRVLRERRVDIAYASTEETNLRKLAAGRLDASVVNRDAVKSAEWVAARVGLRGRVRPAFRVGGMPAYIGFSLAHRDGPALAVRFDDGYDRIVANGTHARIKAQWIARNAARPRAP